eukprot:s2909_g3.t1
MRCATMNIPAAAAKVAAIRDVMQQWDVTILAVQEAGLTWESRPSFRDFWSKNSFEVIFGGVGEDGTTSSLIISKIPIHPLFPAATEVCNAQRVAFGVVELPANDSDSSSTWRKLLVASLYGHVSDHEARDRLIRESFAFASSVGLPWLVLGDYNVTIDEAPLVQLRCSGSAYALDDDFVDIPLSTRPQGRRRIDFGMASRRRRIDFGMASRDVFACDRLQADGLADHDLVIYTLPHPASGSGLSAPRRRRLQASPCAVAQHFKDHWPVEFVAELIHHGDVDAAWSFLSGFAEDALQDDNRPGHRRASFWYPTTHGSQESKASKGGEPVLLRRLRRLLRQVLELGRNPSNDRLRASIVHTGRALAVHFQSLQNLAAWNAEFFVDILKDAIFQFEQHFSSTRRVQWSASLADNLSKQRAWVRDKAAAFLHEETMVGEPQPRTHAVSCKAISIPTRLQAAVDTWEALWNNTSKPPDQGDSMQELFDRVPRPGDFSGFNFFFNGAGLQRVVQGMTGKAAGPDAWQAADLARLPLCWWDAVATLWSTVSSTGKVPRIWTQARVALLPKRCGGQRPLSIVSLLWRAGAKIMLQQLRTWILSWTDHRTLGGLPQRGVAHAHLRLNAYLATLTDDDFVVAEDVAKFFDSISVPQVLEVLRHLRAPEQWLQVIASFYEQGLRIFSIRGNYYNRWCSASRGLLQGCPFSPVIASALMSVWCHNVCANGIDGVTFVDDRTWWPLPGCTNEALFQDAPMKPFSLRSTVVQPLMRVTTTLAFLGLSYDFTAEGAPTLLHFVPKLAMHRLRFIRWAAGWRRHRRLLIQSLVLPLFTFMQILLPSYFKVTGISVWHYNAGQAQGLTRCLCGAREPSRPHLLWNCPSTADLRALCESPLDRAAERLLARVLPEFPPPPSWSDADERRQHSKMVQAVTRSFSTARDVLFFATDGSSTDDVAAWAVHVPAASCTISGGIKGEDQTALRAELEALHHVLLALLEAGATQRALCATKEVVILCDCQTAIDVVVLCKHGGLPLFAKHLHSLFDELQHVFANVSVSWVPAHDRVKESWIPHPVAGDANSRAWNHLADVAARAHAAARARNSLRQRWHASARAAMRWETEVIVMASRVALRYEAFLQSSR